MNSDELPLSRSTTDRDALARTEPAHLHEVWADPRLSALHVHGSKVAIAGEQLDLSDVADDVRRAHVRASSHRNTEDAPTPGWGAPGEAPGGRWAYLGTDHLGPVVAEFHDEAGDHRSWAHLRSIGAILSAREAGLATAAVALANWHDSYRHCPRCGAATIVTASGWVRLCPVDGSHHFPRTDAAVIMAIIDSFDRILLAHNAMWPENRYSVPAGYVEPGEPLEAAVRRETWEETGIRVGRVAYQGSQPWPFPASLMVGFRGVALNSTPIPDGEEITKAQFFTRAEVLAAVRAGEIILPGGTSIARFLIDEWYGEQIPDGPGAF